MIKTIKHHLFLYRTKKALKKFRAQRKREEKYVNLLRKLLAQQEAHEMLKARAEEIVATLFKEKSTKADGEAQNRKDGNT